MGSCGFQRRSEEQFARFGVAGKYKVPVAAWPSQGQLRRVHAAPKTTAPASEGSRYMEMKSGAWWPAPLLCDFLLGENRC